MQHDEYRIQVAIVQQWPKWYPGTKILHVPNQTRDAKEAYFNKQLGVDPGASDLIILDKGPFCGFMEVKSGTGKISPLQNKFLSTVHFYGFKQGVVKSCKEAHALGIAWGLTPSCNIIIEPDLRCRDEKMMDGWNQYHGTQFKSMQELIDSRKV